MELKQFEQEIQREVRDNILPFWINHTVDEAHGGFYGYINNAMETDPEGGQILRHLRQNPLDLCKSLFHVC